MDNLFIDVEACEESFRKIISLFSEEQIDQIKKEISLDDEFLSCGGFDEETVLAMDIIELLIEHYEIIGGIMEMYEIDEYLFILLDKVVVDATGYRYTPDFKLIKVTQ